MSDIQRPRRVFLSYSHDSEAHRERVLALAMRLRAEGVDAWLDRCVQSPAEGWIRWMEHEVKSADFVLVVCTPTYRCRFDGEEAEGRGLGVNFEGATIQKLIYADNQRNEKYVPVLFEDGTGAIPLQLIDVMRYRLPDGYDALYRRLTNQPEVVPGDLGTLRVLPRRSADACRSVASPEGPPASLPDVEISPGPPTSVPRNLPPRSEFFRGRVRELGELHQKLGAEGKLGVTQRVAAWAYGGVGKTALALEYAWQHLADYPGGVFLLSADTDVIEPALAALAQEFAPETAQRLVGKDQAENVRRHLTRGPKALLILDNLRDAKQLRGWQKSLPSEACRLLLTTRSTTLPGITMWPLERLGDDDAMEVLTSRRPDAADPKHRVSVEIVLRACDGLAVAVVAVGAYLARKTHVSWAAYASDLKRRGEAPAFETVRLGAKRLDYATSLDLIFSDLFGALSAPEQRCLQLAALLPPDQVPRSWLGGLLLREPELALETEPGEEDSTVEVLEELKRLQLVRVADEEGRLLTLHRLLGYWLRRTLKDSWRDDLVARIIDFARQRSEASGEARTPNLDLRWELGPLAALCHLLIDWKIPTAAATIAVRVSNALLALGQDLEAQALLEPVVAATDDEEPDALRARLNLSLALYAQGDLSRARGHQEAVLNARRRLLGDDHPDTRAARLNLAVTQCREARFYFRSGRHEPVFETIQRLRGDHHPEAQKAFINLAAALYDCGEECGETVGYILINLEVTCRVLGGDHLDTLKLRSRVAQRLYNSGDLSGARGQWEAVLGARRRVLGDEHPDTFRARLNLAATRCAEGRHSTKGVYDVATLDDVLESIQRLQRDDHPDTRIALRNLAFTLYLNGGDSSSTRGYRQAVLEVMRRLLGDEHPDTLNARNNLAGTLYAQGDLLGARGHQEAVLEARRRLLGTEHPDTLNARDSLSLTLEAQGASSPQDERLP